MEMNKHRMTLELSQRDAALLDGLMRRLQSPSKADVIRQAIRHFAESGPPQWLSQALNEGDGTYRP